MKTYKEQAKMIESLSKVLVKSSKNFANKYDKTNYQFGDLGHVIEELVNLVEFMGQGRKK